MSRSRYGLALLIGGYVTVCSAQECDARPRDDVMSGAYRCAAIGDSRQWLDCYYGAAQPARAALGMSPVPAAQAALVSKLPAGPAAPAEEAIRDHVMASASNCTGGDREWLNCYYAAAQSMRVQLRLPPAPQAKTATPPPLPATHGGTPEADALAGRKRLDTRMASYRFTKDGYFTITLENGQVWRQVVGDTTYAHWNKPAGSYVVHITEGFLNSYNLQVKNAPGLYKVLRAS
jgi:hypothetical protein